MSLFSFVPGPLPSFLPTHFPESLLSLPQQLLSVAVCLREPNEALG